MQTINERLAALPGLLRYDSPAALAKAVGIDPNTLRKAMQGPSKPGFDILHGLLSRHTQLNPSWLLLGKGEPVGTAPTPTSSLVAEPLPAYGCVAPDLATGLAAEVAELRAENKQLKDELRQVRKEAREDLIGQARSYNSVKQGDAELITKLYAYIERQQVEIDEYKLRLGYRQPTAEEAERFKQAESERKPISGFMGQRYSELLEAVEAEATGGKHFFLTLAEEDEPCLLKRAA